MTFKCAVDFIPFPGFRSNLDYNTAGSDRWKYLLHVLVLPNSVVGFRRTLKLNFAAGFKRLQPK